jgi:ATP-dependent DNA ligase
MTPCVGRPSLDELVRDAKRRQLDIVVCWRLEGLVAERLGSRYTPGEHSRDWQKLRLNRSQEFAVGAYSPGDPFDALLVGYYNDAGARLFAARVRAGFALASRRQVFRRLGPPIGTSLTRTSANAAGVDVFVVSARCGRAPQTETGQIRGATATSAREPSHRLHTGASECSPGRRAAVYSSPNRVARSPSHRTG